MSLVRVQKRRTHCTSLGLTQCVSRMSTRRWLNAHGLGKAHSRARRRATMSLTLSPHAHSGDGTSARSISDGQSRSSSRRAEANTTNSYTDVKNNLAEFNWFHSLHCQQIQTLFNSLFKVLFTFPSWYLFAIGLEPIFSLRWNLPPDLRPTIKERDS